LPGPAAPDTTPFVPAGAGRSVQLDNPIIFFRKSSEYLCQTARVHLKLSLTLERAENLVKRYVDQGKALGTPLRCAKALPDHIEMGLKWKFKGDVPLDVEKREAGVAD
jgi:hypothetical protein